MTILLVAALAGGVRALASEPEDERKAAAVLMFLRFSEWPDSGRPARHLHVGVVGRPALAEVLRRVLEGKVVNGRTLRVVDPKNLREPRRCHVVYVAADKSAEIKAALAADFSARALTIGESERFLEAGGGVNLFLIDGRMSFEVSLETLERAGVTVSSKLLRVGRIRESGNGRRP